MICVIFRLLSGGWSVLAGWSVSPASTKPRWRGQALMGRPRVMSRMPWMAHKAGIDLRPAHRGPAFRQDTRQQPHATPGQRGASLLVPAPHSAASSGTGPWLQFWLQSTRVHQTPGRYIRPGQNPPGPTRTVDNRAFNPWVQGSSPGASPRHRYPLRPLPTVASPSIGLLIEGLCFAGTV